MEYIHLTLFANQGTIKHKKKTLSYHNTKTYQRRSRVSLMGDCRVIIGGGSEELIFSSFDNGWWFAEYKCM